MTLSFSNKSFDLYSGFTKLSIFRVAFIVSRSLFVFFDIDSFVDSLSIRDIIHRTMNVHGIVAYLSKNFELCESNSLTIDRVLFSISIFDLWIFKIFSHLSLIYTF